MGCEREAVLRLLARLEYELADALRGCRCPDKCREECLHRAMEKIEVYEYEVKELLREEPVFGK